MPRRFPSSGAPRRQRLYQTRESRCPAWAAARGVALWACANGGDRPLATEFLSRGFWPPLSCGFFVSPPRAAAQPAPAPNPTRCQPPGRPSPRPSGGRDRPWAGRIIQAIQVVGNRRIEAGYHPFLYAGPPRRHLRSGPAGPQRQDAVLHRPVPERSAQPPGQRADRVRRGKPAGQQSRVRGQQKAQRR